MLFGIALALTDRSVRPDEVARLAEERGFESLFVTEHTHVPADHSASGASLPEAYRRTLDPIVALTAAAGATRALRLGTSVMLAAQHEPLVTAKALASLDLLSGGRVELGVGAGWVEQELANHGVPFDRRFAQLREHVDAMRAIWRDEIATYEGDVVRFRDVCSWPKPVQRLARVRALSVDGRPGEGLDGTAPDRVAGIPVLLGGDGPTVLDRVLAYGDGWLPRAPGGLEELAPRVRALHARCATAQRPPLPVTLYNCATDPATLEAYRELGLHRGLLRIPSGDVGAVERALDAAAEAVRPAE